MGTYYIPRNLKGESRILYIFTAKSLIYTAAGATLGFILYMIFGMLLNIKPLGIACLAICALMGYGIGTIKFPAGGTSKIAKNVGGDSLDEVIMRYVNFKRNNKVYTYAVPRDEHKEESTLDKMKFNFNFNTKEEK